METDISRPSPYIGAETHSNYIYKMRVSELSAYNPKVSPHRTPEKRYLFNIRLLYFVLVER